MSPCRINDNEMIACYNAVRWFLARRKVNQLKTIIVIITMFRVSLRRCIRTANDFNKCITGLYFRSSCISESPEWNRNWNAASRLNYNSTATRSMKKEFQMMLRRRVLACTPICHHVSHNHQCNEVISLSIVVACICMSIFWLDSIKRNWNHAQGSNHYSLGRYFFSNFSLFELSLDTAK